MLNVPLPTLGIFKHPSTKLHQRIYFDRSHTTQKIVYNFNFPLLMISAHFLWRLENPKPFSERRFFKRYLTFWNLYNLFADFFFLVGLLLKLLELLMVEEVINTRKSLNNHLFILFFFPSQTAKHFLKAFMSFVCYRPIQQFKWLTRELST